MGGSSIDDEWELTSFNGGVRTVVLVGRTGNGKSATGNSILGTKAFKSRRSSAGVTSTCELERTVTSDGQIINVIDTPEIARCIDLAKDGIHAVFVVLSVRTRFTKEEEAAILSLQTLFGSKIIDYMIVVFTGGDELEENEETLEGYLGPCPEPLKNILNLCRNRRVLFDNKTTDKTKKAEQVRELLSLVNMVIAQNGGKPYTYEWFTELKTLRSGHQKEIESLKGKSNKEISELKEDMKRSYDDQLKRISDSVELRLREATTRIEQQEKNLESAKKETRELRQKVDGKRCAIL